MEHLFRRHGRPDLEHLVLPLSLERFAVLDRNDFDELGQHIGPAVEDLGCSCALGPTVMSLDQVRAANPVLDYEGVYGRSTTWTTSMFVEAMYRDLSNRKASTSGR